MAFKGENNQENKMVKVQKKPKDRKDEIDREVKKPAPAPVADPTVPIPGHEKDIPIKESRGGNIRNAR